jgi:hypothetical protein
MTPNRVLLYAMVPMLHDIFDQLLRGVPDVRLVAGAAGATSLVEAATLADADVVIADEHAVRLDDVCALLARRNHTRALSVAHDGRTGVLFELRPHRHPIGDLSPDAVLAAVRSVPPCAEQLQPDPPPRPAP